MMKEVLSSLPTRFFSVIAVTLLFGCIQNNTTDTNSVDIIRNTSEAPKENCLPPLFTYAYPDTDENPELMPPGMLPTTLPQPVLEVPLFWLPQLTNTQLNSFSEKSPGTTPPPTIRSDVIEITGDDIWFSDSVYILRYNKKSGELKTYKIFDVGHVVDLFADSQGTLWVAVNIFPSSPTALLKYGPKQDTFEPVPANDNSLASDQDRLISQIIGRFDGKLWLVFSKQLYAFDVKTGKATLVGDKEIKIYNATMTSDGQIWFAANYKDDSKTTLIYRFDPRSQQTDITSFPLEKYQVSPTSVKLASDKKGRIWVNNLGWFELYENVDSFGHPIVRSFSLLPFSGFIGQGVEYQYVMMTANHVSGLSDGTVWFTSNAGISKLNPSTGNWCILARNVPGIALAEDNNHFVWFAYGQLYKYALGK